MYLDVFSETSGVHPAHFIEGLTNTDGRIFCFVPALTFTNKGPLSMKRGVEDHHISIPSYKRTISDSMGALFFIGSAIRSRRNASSNDSSKDNDRQQVWKPGEEVIVNARVRLLDTG